MNYAPPTSISQRIVPHGRIQSDMIAVTTHSPCVKSHHLERNTGFHLCLSQCFPYCLDLQGASPIPWGRKVEAEPFPNSQCIWTDFRADPLCVAIGLANCVENVPWVLQFTVLLLLARGAEWNSAMRETWVQNIFVSYLPSDLLAHLVLLAGLCVNFVHVDAAILRAQKLWGTMSTMLCSWSSVHRRSIFTQTASVSIFTDTSSVYQLQA